MSIAATAYLDLAGLGTFTTDISQYLLEASIQQGRKQALDPMEPASAIIKLNNRDGRFSPRNAVGAYYPDFDENYRGIRVRAGADSRAFTGYITAIDQDPYIGSQEVVLTCTDRLGLLRYQLLKAGPFRQQPVYLILNRLLDRLERGEEIANPGGEGGSTTGYSAVPSGVTLTAPDSISFEGDCAIQCVCDGTVSGQGSRYDLGAAVDFRRQVSLFARTAPGDGGLTLKLRGLNASLVEIWSFNFPVVDSGWSYINISDILTYTHRYIELITQAAVPVTIISDCLHQIPVNYRIARSIPTTLDAIAELVALYDAPALEALEKLAATEGAGFLWMGGYMTWYGTVYASCQAARDLITTPAATFADDGSGVWYSGFRGGWDGRQRISEARVESEGSYEDDNEEATLWEHSPVPLEVPASTTVKLRAEYSSPARKCVLEVAGASGAGKYKIAAAANDGYLKKSGMTYPPTGTPTVETPLAVGQPNDGALYRKLRGFLRWDTSGIGAGATVTAAKLRLYLRYVYRSQVWTLQARQPGGSGYDWSPLDSSDWSATPGSDTLRGSLASSNFPPTGQWVEITLDVATINKTGITALYLCSDRDVSDTAPVGYTEHAIFGAYEVDPEYAAQLEVNHSALVPVTQVFRNYGTGADIELTAGAQASTLYSILVKGIPLTAASERSLVVAEPASPPPVPNPLSVEMPHQATRSADMTTEASRLATRYSASINRCEIDLTEQDSAALAQMQARQLNDLVAAKNTKFDHSTKVNGNFFLEGLAWAIREQGKVLTVTLNLEQK